MGLADGCASKASANIGTFSELAKFFELKAVFFFCFAMFFAVERMAAHVCGDCFGLFSLMF